MHAGRFRPGASTRLERPLGNGEARGTIGRGARGNQRSAPDQGRADASRFARGGRGPAVGRGCAVRRTIARAGRDHRRQDHDCRIRLEGRHRFAPARHHAQSMEPAADAGWFERRLRGGSAGPHGRAGDRHRWRRVNPHSGGVYRHRGVQAHVRSRARVSIQPRRHDRASRAHHPHGRRRRADDGGDWPARRARLVRPAGA